MKLKIFNLFENLLDRVLFTIFYSILLFPLTGILIFLFTGYLIKSELFWYFALSTFSGIFIFDLFDRIGITFLRKVFLLLLASGVTFFITSLLGVSPVMIDNMYFSPYQFCLIIIGGYLFLGLRFIRMESRRSDFFSDFTFGVILLFILLSFNQWSSFPITITQILLFFISGIALLIHRKVLNSEAKTAKKQNSWIGSSIMVLLFIILFPLVITFGFSKKAGEIILIPILFLLDLIEKVLSYVLLIILRILEPLINFIYQLFSGVERIQEESPATVERIITQNEQLGELLQRSPHGYSWITRGIIFLLVVLIAYYILKKIQWSKDSQQEYDESRESIFDPLELKNDFLNMLNSIRNKFRRRPRTSSIYDQSSIVIKIREVYYNFLNRFSEIVPYYKHKTPLEYKHQFLRYKKDANHALEEITNVYQKARYNQGVVDKDLVRIKKAYNELLEKTITKK